MRKERGGKGSSLQTSEVGTKGDESQPPYYRQKLLSEIVQAFRYPFVGRKFPKRFLLGCLVSIVPLVGDIVVLGYAYRSMQGIMEGADELPRWEDFIGLFLWGIKVIGVCFVYGIAFLVPFSLGLFFILVIPHIIAVNIGFIFLVLSSVLFLSSAFVVPMALIFMIHSGGSFREAIRFEDVLITIRDSASTYIVRSFIVWLIALLSLIVMLLIISIRFGHLFAMIPAFYLLTIGSYVFGIQGKEVFSEKGTVDVSTD